MINTLSKINLSKIGWEGGRSTSIWIMPLNILFFFRVPLTGHHLLKEVIFKSCKKKNWHLMDQNERVIVELLFQTRLTLFTILSNFSLSL